MEYDPLTQRFMPLRPLIFTKTAKKNSTSSASVDELDIVDDEYRPMTVSGISSNQQIAIVIKSDDQTHLTVYQRYKKLYFRKHFVLSNKMGNMGEMNAFHVYKVVSFDYT